MDVLRSNGEDEVRVFAIVEVPRCGTPPEVEEEDRVQIVDPRQVSTVRRAARRTSAGPRNPLALVSPPAETALPAVDLPDARPVTKAQRVVLDPEVVARWKEQAREEAKKESP